MNNTKDKEYYGFIYITTNHVNNKKYIGKKKYDKKSAWKSYLGSGIILKKAIEKYGRENFSKEIIEECYSKEELNEREIYWINYYNAVKSEDFYNISSGGDGGNNFAGYNKEQRKEYSKKLSESLKALGTHKLGRKGKDNVNAKPVILLNTMEVFPSSREAGEKYNVNKQYIKNACNYKEGVHTAGKHPETGEGLYWQYYYPDKEYIYIPPSIIHSKNNKNKSYVHGKIYYVEGNKIYNSVEEVSNDLGLSVTYIRKCCEHNIKTKNGKHFLYYDEYVEMSEEEVEQIRRERKFSDERIDRLYWEHNHNNGNKFFLCIDTNTLYFSSMEAEQKTGINHSSIVRCCKGKQETAGGYTWKYATDDEIYEHLSKL